MRLSDAKMNLNFCFFFYFNVIRPFSGYSNMGYEIQKIFTAILIIFLVVFGIGKISDIIFQTEENVVAYKVEVQEKSSTASSSQAIDISAFLAMGNVDHGKKVFKKCAACHSINQGGGNKIGPALWSVMSRNAGDLGDYKYSKALTSYGKKWNFEELNGFLLKPATWIKGNKMGFAGLKDDKDRASVILYMNENSDNPLPLP
tara:strand:- start:276 stop:881 length:606 start_codon:yes stop_codon:yes gene_type:complete